MLDELKLRFCITNDAWIYELKAAIVNCKQKRLTWANYFTEFKKLWDKLIDYEQTLICECKDVTMELTKCYKKGKLPQFLIKLDNTMFGTTCSNILNETPLPTMNQAYSKIIWEEFNLRKKLRECCYFCCSRMQTWHHHWKEKPILYKLQQRGAWHQELLPNF